MEPHKQEIEIVIIGGGPAGLTAGYLLAKEKIPLTILEFDPKYVGGIARTVNYKNYCFDIGGHRFFSKAKEIEDLWTEMLPNDFLNCSRSSRIFYRRNFFSYPLKAFEALTKLGLIESFLCILSYIKAWVFQIKQPKNFSDWVTNRFGSRLFTIFFKTYTEKVWGMRCEEISSDWAAQRIQGLSLFAAIKNALLPNNWFKRQDSNVIKTLIENFRYPSKGPGMLWEACEKSIKQLGGNVYLGCNVYQCRYESKDKKWHILYKNNEGNTKKIMATHLISSAPLRNLILDYLPPTVLSKITREAAAQLSYRDFLIVVLILKDRNQFSDNWIYIHEPDVDVARIQNFKSWSADMVPEANMCCYGMEYFCFDNDQIWSTPDELLVQKATDELISLGLAKKEDIVDGCVVRQPKAYPVYDTGYKVNVNKIKQELEEKFPSLYLVGRNGMHKYNNQDHAMMTSMLTVKNILAGKTIYDVWQINQDAEYIESGSATAHPLLSGLRDTPRRNEIINSNP
jgi:protoporphyrinogen oxidase